MVRGCRRVALEVLRIRVFCDFVGPQTRGAIEWVRKRFDPLGVYGPHGIDQGHDGLQICSHFRCGRIIYCQSCEGREMGDINAVAGRRGRIVGRRIFVARHPLQWSRC